MPAIMKEIDKMSSAEKLQTMDYICSSLTADDGLTMPAWHRDELAATEARVAKGIEKPISWRIAKTFLTEMA